MIDVDIVIVGVLTGLEVPHVAKEGEEKPKKRIVYERKKKKGQQHEKQSSGEFITTYITFSKRWQNLEL